MKLIVYADLHLRDGTELCNTVPGQLLQHYRVRKFFSDLNKIYKDYACDGLVDLGDTTDDRTSLSLLTLNCLGDCFQQLPKGSRWKLIGNHEQYLRDTTINTRALFTPWFKVIEKREVIHTDNCALVFASYPENHRELAEWLIATARKISGPKILFGHFEVNGARLNNGQILDGVPAEAVNDYDYALLGHIHLPQNIERLYYLGPPFQQNFGDTGVKNRVAVVDTETLTIQFVYLKGYPEYKKVSYEEFQALTKKELNEDRYKVVLTSQDEANRFFSRENPRHAVAEYHYTENPGVEAATESPPDWSFEAACKRYLEKYPPDRFGIKIAPEEILKTAKILVEK